MSDDNFDALVSAMRAGPPIPEDRSQGPIIFFHTPWELLDDGWSVAARAYARAMEMGGLDVRLVTWKPSGVPLDPDVMIEVGRFARPPREWDLHIFSGMLAGAKYMADQLIGLRGNPGPQAMHCVFERWYVEPDLVRALNLLDGVWAQCSSNRDVLVKYGVKNTTLIHHPYFDDDPLLSLPAPTKSKRFYWIGRDEPRKAPDNLLKAFMRAFVPGDATLTMKMSMYRHAGPFPSPEATILEELTNPQSIRNGWTLHNWSDSIRLIRGRLTSEEMLKLHNDNDVYVSASRGEGLDLCAFAAKVAGRQLVLTDSGGPRDFMNDGDILIPSIGFIPADKHYYWGEGAIYTDYKLDDLIAGLQSARSSTPRGSRMDSMFRAERVGPVFREWVEALLQK